MSNAQQNNAGATGPIRGGIEYLYRLGKTVIVVMLVLGLVLTATLALTNLAGLEGASNAGTFFVVFIGWFIWTRYYAKANDIPW